MEFIHIKSGKSYQFITQALFQNEKGEWVDCVVYKGEDRDKTFVRLQEDFEKSFKKRVYTLEELDSMLECTNHLMRFKFERFGYISFTEQIKYNEELKFIEYQKEKLKNA